MTHPIPHTWDYKPYRLSDRYFYYPMPIEPERAQKER